MNKTLRHVLGFVSIVLFLSVTPFIVLYAIGYRIGPAGLDPTAIGVLLFETVPRRADILVNGTAVGRTPKAVPNLPAGDVEIALQKEGYVTWKKTVTVESTVASDFRSIHLFPTDPVRKSLATEVANFSVSPNQQIIAVVNEANELSIVDTDGIKVSESAKPLPFSIAQMLWSSDNSTVALLGANKVALASLNGTNIEVEVIESIKNPSTVKWDSRISQQLLYTSGNNTLMSYHVSGGESAVIAKNIIAFTTSGSTLYAVASDSSVIEYSIQGEQKKKTDSNTSSPIKSIDVTSNGLVAGITASRDALVLLGAEPRKIASNATSISWSGDGTLLLVGTATNEIHVYNHGNDQVSYIPKGSTQLITRSSKPINHLRWYPGDRYVMYQVDTDIIISEIDIRDHVLSFTADTVQLTNPRTDIDRTGSILYYLKKEGATTSLVQSDLAQE